MAALLEGLELVVGALARRIDDEERIICGVCVWCRREAQLFYNSAKLNREVSSLGSLALAFGALNVLVVRLQQFILTYRT